MELSYIFSCKIFLPEYLFIYFAFENHLSAHQQDCGFLQGKEFSSGADINTLFTNATI